MFLKTNLFKAIPFKPTTRLPVSYWILVGLRFVLTLLPQTGYIHPDEYFQNVEVIAGDIFDVDVARTWEFDPKFPIRNIFVPKLMNRLKIFASSYVVLVYCCRSFSNSFEMVFFSILLYLVGDCMLKSDKVIYHKEYLQEKYNEAATPVERVKIYKLQTHLPQHSLNYVLILASLVVIVLVIIDSAYYGYLTIGEVESLQLTWNNWVVTPLNFLRYNADVRNLSQHGLHPRWLHLAVNVPLLFNVLGAMALFTVLINSYRFIKGKYSKMPRIQSIRGLMLLSAIAPIAILSLFPHQEARFIIPILVPLVYLYGNSIHINEIDDSDVQILKKIFLFVWYTSNIVLSIFFGFIHQGGLYPLVNDLFQEIKGNYGMHIHVITTHSYSIPTYLLQLESTTRIYKEKTSKHTYTIAPSTFVSEFGSLPMDKLLMHVDDTLTTAEMRYHKYKKKYRLYIASPCSLEDKLLEEASNYEYIKVKEEFSYYPHFSTEALPSFPDAHDRSCVSNEFKSNSESSAINLNMLQRVSCYLSKFCLKLYNVKVIDTT
ncbi:unnamed protein product [Colias eurytheme]|nr:unnamed protein product [Colias eurytheme]